MQRILITDFDGTLCQNEFYQLVSERILPADTPNYWSQFVRGELSHLAVLQAYFSAIRAEEEAVLALLKEMKLEPRFEELGKKLVEQGWSIIVASAGCDWYIRKLLEPLEVPLTLHTNHGRWRGGKHGLEMTPPLESPFYSAEYGIDKAAIVADALQTADGGRVVFAGDGLTDVAGMLLLPSSFRFARRDCAGELQRRGESFQPFDRWAEVALSLLENA